jgi:hypothetical protein
LNSDAKLIARISYEAYDVEELLRLLRNWAGRTGQHAYANGFDALGYATVWGDAQMIRGSRIALLLVQPAIAGGRLSLFDGHAVPGISRTSHLWSRHMGAIAVSGCDSDGR